MSALFPPLGSWKDAAVAICGPLPPHFPDAPATGDSFNGEHRAGHESVLLKMMAPVPFESCSAEGRMFTAGLCF